MKNKIAIFLICLLLGSGAFYLQPDKCHVHCVAVGINSMSKRYDDFSREADVVADAVERNLHARAVRITGENAIKSNVISSLRNLKCRMKSDDTAIIYIGTHGTWEPDSEFKSYLCDGTLSPREIMSALHGHQGHILIIFDACHSGGSIQDWRGQEAILAACEGDQCTGTWRLCLSIASALDNKKHSVMEIKKFVAQDMMDKFNQSVTATDEDFVFEN